LAADPEILVLDEAVAALDPIIQKQVLDLLIRIQEKTGIRYVFITHNPEAARYLCHRYIRLEKGVCTEAGAY
jgi:ABC-type glutathione transport system ATPase component